MSTSISGVAAVTTDAWTNPNANTSQQQVAAVPPVQQTVENSSQNGGQTAGQTTSQAASQAASKTAGQTASQDAQKTGKETKANAQPPTPDQLKAMAKQLQDYLAQINVSLKFDVDDTTHQLIVKVVNPETGELIRQIPSEDVVKVQEKLAELRGVLYSGKL